MKKRLKKVIRIVKNILFYSFLAISFLMGLALYRIFLGYVPGINITDLFISKVGIPAFPAFGIIAGVLISFPVLILAFQVYFKYSSSYVSFASRTGKIHLSDHSISGFISDIVLDIAGVESAEISVDIFKENRVGIHIWVDTDQKSDFVQFSEKIQQKVLQELDNGFGIKNIKYFHVYIESTNINTGKTGYKVNYK
jgi:hypothetical protein